MLRKCQQCGNDLSPSATARAKYCSPRCRVRASRARSGAPALEVVRIAASVETPVVASHSSTHREALQRAVARLERLLDMADPRSAAPLNKEYRETLRELETLAVAGQQLDVVPRERRAFDPSAV